MESGEADKDIHAGIVTICLRESGEQATTIFYEVTFKESKPTGSWQLKKRLKSERSSDV